MKPALLFSLVCLPLAGAAGGYWWGVNRSARELQEVREALQKTDAATAALPATGPRKKEGRIPMPGGMESLNLSGIFGASGPLDRFQAIFAHVQNLPAGELEEEILNVREQLQAGSMDPDRLFAMHLLMTRFGVEQPERAVRWLNGQDMMIRGFGTATVLAGIASKDPARASKLFADAENPILKMPRVGSYAATGVAREWSKSDPKAALAWAQSLPEESRGGAYAGIVGGMMTEDPLAATRTAQELPPGEDRDRLMGNIAENWGTKDPQAALQWANSLQGEEKAEATKKALAGWAGKDPQAAAAHLASLGNTERDAGMPAVASRWANRDPAAAATWLASQPEGAGRKDAMGSVMGTWSETEPEKASAWLVAQPAGPSKDQGIVTLANSQVRSDPEAALTWAATITDPMTRSLQLKGNVRQWLRRDPGAATQWVATAPGLSPEERTELLPAPKSTTP